MSKQVENESISFVGPIVLGFLVWAISNWYFNKNETMKFMNNIRGTTEEGSEFVVTFVPLCPK
jgi:hypothetical protein